MAVNVEIKAHARDFTRLQQVAEKLSDTPCQAVPQEDTFFNCPNGRLKLRELNPKSGQLVYYRREDSKGPKHSDYEIFETKDPSRLKMILAEAFGVRGIISKTRYLYMAGQTRIHLDEVVGLGKFVELEVVLQPGQTDAEGRAIAENLMQALGIQAADLIGSAYIDLIEK